MSAFQGISYNVGNNSVVQLFEHPHITFLYGSRPLFLIEQRIVRNPQTDAQKKDCDSYLALPLFKNSTVLLGSFTRNVKSLMELLERWFPETYGISYSDSFLTANGTAMQTNKITYTAPVMISCKANEVSSFVYSFLIYYILLTMNSFTGSINSLFTNTLLSPLTKSPINDPLIEPFYLWMLVLCAVYQLFAARKPAVESPMHHYQQMHDEEQISVDEDEEHFVQEGGGEEEEGGEGEEAVVEAAAQEEEAREEQEVVREEEAREEVVGEEEGDGDEEEEEEFIECERLEYSDEEKEEEKDDDVGVQLNNLLLKREAMGKDIGPVEQLTHLKDNTYELQTYCNKRPILVVQWPSQHGTKRVALHFCNYFPAMLLGALAHGVLMPIALTFLGRCFFSVLLSSALLQFPFYLLYKISGNYWFTKQMFVLGTQLFQYRYNPSTREHKQNLNFAIKILTRNLLVAFLVSMLIPSFHNWSILDTMHFYWIMRVFRII